MAHAESQRHAEGRATQSCSRSASTKGSSRGGVRACRNLLALPSPSLPLLGTSTRAARAGSRCRSENSFYRQAFSICGGQAPRLCVFDWADLKRNRQPGCCAVPEPRTETWLKSRRMASKWPFGWSISLIGWRPKSSLKFMKCWYPKNGGRLIAPRLDSKRP